jgi:hypothetical protein
MAFGIAPQRVTYSDGGRAKGYTTLDFWQHHTASPLS